MGRACSRTEDGRNAFKMLTGKPTRRRPLGMPRRRWKDTIKMDLEEIGINAGNWVDSASNLRVPEATELVSILKSI